MDDERVMSFSQFGEDLTLHHYFPNEVGRFLDVGSGHPWEGSNTALLYKRGWTGIAVEANKSLAELHRKERPKDRVLNCLAGKTHERRKFHALDPWQYSTTNQSFACELERAGKARIVSESIIEVVPLRSLGLNINPEDPFMLNLDVEGAELEVLAGLDFSVFRPRLIMVEELSNPLLNTSRIKFGLGRKGYKLVSYHFRTSHYLHSSRIDLAGFAGFGN